MTAWHETHTNIAALAHFLVEECGCTEHDLLDFLDDPVEWSGEWNECEFKSKAEKSE